MIITGIAIAEFDFRELITDIKVYIMSFIRLLLIPFLALIILRPIAPIDVTRSAVLLLAMPCGLNTILLPKLVGADCKTGAKLAFISNILALATIPLILGQLN